MKLLSLKSRQRRKNSETKLKCNSTNVNGEAWRLVSKLVWRCSVFHFQDTLADDLTPHLCLLRERGNKGAEFSKNTEKGSIQFGESWEL